MLDRNDDRTYPALVSDVLTALRANLIEHKEIVEEAQAGYLTKCYDTLVAAQKTITERIEAMDSGAKPNMEHFLFGLTPPVDHSKDFSTIIKIMELHQAAHAADLGNKGPAITMLKMVDVRRFVENDWDWSDAFLLSNARYSAKSQLIAATKGLL
jgi:hypothetical protein